MNSTFGWNVKNEIDGDKDFAELELYGDVTSYQLKEWKDDFSGLKNAQCICPEGFLEALKELEGKKNILVRLNTCGGDVITGLWIYNRLKSLKANISVLVEGIAASAGSVIAMAASNNKQRKVYSASDIMVHGVSVGVCGWLNAADLKKVTKTIDAFNLMLVNVFTSATGQSEEKVRGWLDRETHFIGREAVENGLADEVIDGDSQLQFVASAKGNMIMNDKGYAINASFFVPERVKQIMTVKTEDVIADESENSTEESVKDSVSTNIIDESNIKDGGAEMEIKTLDDLKKAYPDMCTALEAEAKNSVDKDAIVNAERKRIQDIDAISFRIADKALVEKAKYETGRTASDLLMEDALAERVRNEQKLQALDNDSKVTENVQAGVTNIENELEKGKKPVDVQRQEAKDFIKSVLGGVK